MQDDDHQDGGWRQDRARGFGRRGALALLGAGLLGGMGPVWRGRAAEALTGTGADGGLCVALPQETAGPYPADGTNSARSGPANVLAQSGVERSDLRGSFAGLAGHAEGVAMDLELRLVDVNAACAPLAGRAVYLWHCDGRGKYSIYDLAGANYLRGLQVSDGQGLVRFTTILPGCYMGRTPHLHFEVFDSPAAVVDGKAARLTSQLAVPEAACAAVYAADPRYEGSAAALARSPLARDMVFGDNAPLEVEAATLILTGDAAAGFRASAVVGLAG